MNFWQAGRTLAELAHPLADPQKRRGLWAQHASGLGGLLDKLEQAAKEAVKSS